MFNTLSNLIFGGTVISESTSETQGQGQGSPELNSVESDDEWVIVKNEEESFLLSSEILTRNRVNLHEDLSRENFLIEHPLSLSSEEIELRIVKIGRKPKRKSKRNNNVNVVVRTPSRNTLFNSLIPNQRSPTQSTSSRALTLINNNRNQGFQNCVPAKRQGHENYNYKTHLGLNNGRTYGKKRASS